MKRFIRRTLSVLLALLLLTGSLQVSAQSSGDLQKQKKEINAKTQSMQNALQEARNQKDEVLAELIEMDLAIEELDAELAFIEEELAKTKQALEQAEKDLAEAMELRQQQQDALIKRLRVMDENGVFTYIQILFDSKSILDFLDKLENVKTIAEYDKNLYAQLENTEKKITDTIAEIEKKKRELELLLTQKQNKMAILEESVEAKHKRVLALEADEKGYEQSVNELKASSDEIEKLIKAAAAAEAKKAAASAPKATTAVINYSGGKLSWPVQGTVSSGYGNRKDPFTGRTAFHSGLDIPAPRGTAVRAAADGVIICSEWRSGYGYTIIIDHGESLSTLYGHNSKLVVSVGDVVVRGQKVAEVGSTGRSTGNHCHFEVRVNGNYTNPNSYLGR